MRFRDHKIIISPEYSEVTDRIKDLGVELVYTKPINNLIPYERFHADMQALAIGDTVFISKSSLNLAESVDLSTSQLVMCNELERNYPKNVALNAALVGNNLLCKSDSIAVEVKDYCKINDINVVDTKQGYAKCSALVLNSNALITSDVSISKSAAQKNIDVLLINEGHIYLDDNTCGFIGGASGVVGDTVMFFGDIMTHPDCDKIVEYIKQNGMEYVSLCGGVLRDIGGLVLIK